MEVFADIVQGSDEWLQIRAGLPTASCFAKVQAKKGPRGGTSSKEYTGRQKYLWALAGEVLTGEPMDSYINSDMERGHEREPEARDLYHVLKGVEPEQVGFIRNGNCGCSPDSLIGASGLLEIKDAKAHVQIERLLAGRVPPEHIPQVQGQLMVSQREWCDFMSHCRGLPPLIKRVFRDEAYIAALRIDVNDFVDELNELVERIRRM